MGRVAIREQRLREIWDAFTEMHGGSDSDNPLDHVVCVAWYRDGGRENLDVETWRMLLGHRAWLVQLFALQAFRVPRETKRGEYVAPQQTQPRFGHVASGREPGMDAVARSLAQYTEDVHRAAPAAGEAPPGLAAGGGPGGAAGVGAPASARLRVIRLGLEFTVDESGQLWLSHATDAVTQAPHARHRSGGNQLSNRFLAQGVSNLLEYLRRRRRWHWWEQGTADDKDSSERACFMLAMGNGANVAAAFVAFHWHDQINTPLSDCLRALILVNGFAFVDSSIKRCMSRIIRMAGQAAHSERVQNLCKLLFSAEFLATSTRQAVLSTFFENRHRFLESAALEVDEGAAQAADMKEEDAANLDESKGDAAAAASAAAAAASAAGGTAGLGSLAAARLRMEEELRTNVAAAEKEKKDKDAEVERIRVQNEGRQGLGASSKITSHGSESDEESDDGDGGEGGVRERRGRRRSLLADVPMTKEVRQGIEEGGVDWLRAELEARGLESTGLKTDMVRALEATLAAEKQAEAEAMQGMRERSAEAARLKKEREKLAAEEEVRRRRAFRAARKVEMRAMRAQALEAERNARLIDERRDMAAADEFSHALRIYHQQQLAKVETNAMGREFMEELADGRDEQRAMDLKIKQDREKAAKREQRRQRMEMMKRQFLEQELKLAGDEVGYGLDANADSVQDLVDGVQRLKSDYITIRGRKSDAMVRHDQVVEKRMRLERQVRERKVAVHDTYRGIRLLEKQIKASTAKLAERSAHLKARRGARAEEENLRRRKAELESLREHETDLESEMHELGVQLKTAKEEMRLVSSLVQRMNLIQREKGEEVERMAEKVGELNAALQRKERSQRRGDVRARKRRAELVFAKDGRETRLKEVLLEKKRCDACDAKYIDTSVWHGEGNLQRVEVVNLSRFLDRESKLLQEAIDVAADELVAVDELIAQFAVTSEVVKKDAKVIRSQNSAVADLRQLVHQTAQDQIREKEEADRRRELSMMDQRKKRLERRAARDCPSLRARTRRKAADSRTDDEKAWVSYDLLLNPDEYMDLDDADLEVYKYDEKYKCNLPLEALQRVVALPEALNLAMPFLRSADEIRAHQLIQKYTFERGHARLRERDAELSTVLEEQRALTDMKRRVRMVRRRNIRDEIRARGIRSGWLLNGGRIADSEVRLTDEEQEWMAYDRVLYPHLYTRNALLSGVAEAELLEEEASWKVSRRGAAARVNIGGQAEHLLKLAGDDRTQELLLTKTEDTQAGKEGDSNRKHFQVAYHKTELEWIRSAATEDLRPEEIHVRDLLNKFGHDKEGWVDIGGDDPDRFSDAEKRTLQWQEEAERAAKAALEKRAEEARRALGKWVKIGRESQLCVEVLSANGLFGTDLLGTSDPYATISVDSDGDGPMENEAPPRPLTTSVVNKTVDPVWEGGERFVVPVDGDQGQWSSGMVHLDIWDWDQWNTHVSLGRASIPIHSVPVSIGKPLLHTTLTLGSHPCQGDDDPPVTGEISFRVWRECSFLSKAGAGAAGAAAAAGNPSGDEKGGESGEDTDLALAADAVLPGTAGKQGASAEPQVDDGLSDSDSDAEGAAAAAAAAERNGWILWLQVCDAELLDHECIPVVEDEAPKKVVRNKFGVEIRVDAEEEAKAKDARRGIDMFVVALDGTPHALGLGKHLRRSMI
eukprot:g928.t1